VAVVGRDGARQPQVGFDEVDGPGAWLQQQVQQPRQRRQHGGRAGRPPQQQHRHAAHGALAVHQAADTDWPNRCASCWPTRRATVSEAPSGGWGTTMRTGLSG
jgi:hypothetical protein